MDLIFYFEKQFEDSNEEYAGIGKKESRRKERRKIFRFEVYLENLGNVGTVVKQDILIKIL